MQLSFTKMHGLGNDFVVIDGVNQTVSLTAEQVRRLANRRFGVGCDQVLLVEPAQTPEVDFQYRIFNADGGEVGQCGNGARCLARFVREKGLSNKDTLRVQTAGGILTLTLEPEGQVRVDMGAPHLAPADIPFEALEQAPVYDLQLDGEHVTISTASMGNPHAVLEVDDIAAAPVGELGPRIQQHPRFPEGANVGFMQILTRDHIRLRVLERGAGETLACGTGACAAVVTGQLRQRLDETVQVDLPGGRCVVSWRGPDGAVYLTGPATRVFEGQIDL